MSQLPASPERQLEFARIWHRVFSSNLIYVVQDIQQGATVNPGAVGDHGACQLGQWLNAQSPVIRAVPAYASLVAVHTDYHRAAEALATAYLEGDQAQVEALLGGDFQRFSEGVMAQIDRLGLALAEAGIFVQRFNEAPPKTRATIWDLSLEVGIPHIDQRHQSIAALIDELVSSNDGLCCPTTDLHFLNALTTLIESDIQAEQQYLAGTGLSLERFAGHFADHQRVLDYIQSLSNKINASEAFNLAEVGQYLGKWFVEHLITHDMELLSLSKGRA